MLSVEVGSCSARMRGIVGADLCGGLQRLLVALLHHDLGGAPVEGRHVGTSDNLYVGSGCSDGMIFSVINAVDGGAASCRLSPLRPICDASFILTLQFHHLLLSRGGRFALKWALGNRIHVEVVVLTLVAGVNRNELL